MCQQHGIDRRSFIRDMGKGVLGIAVLGVAACSSGSEESTDASAVNTATTAATSTTTTAPETTTTTAATTTSAAAAGFDIRRVDLGFVSAYVAVRAGQAAIIDTGNGGNAGDIEAVLAEIGLGWGEVGHVILTHRHPDHVGSLGEVLAQATGADAYTGSGDVEAISSPRPVLGLDDGAELFGLQIVGTPGHTAGHISVFDPAAGVLVAGDALNGTGSSAPGAESGVGGPNPQFTPDMATAEESVRKMAALSPDTIYFGHGEPLIGGAAPLLEALAAGLG